MRKLGLATVGVLLLTGWMALAAGEVKAPHVFFTQSDNGPARLMRMDETAPKPVALTDDKLRVESASWSPDGQTVVCYRKGMIEGNPRSEFLVMAADGTDTKTIDITKADYNLGGAPVLLDGGKRIGFATSSLPEETQVKVGKSNPAIVTMDLQGKDVKIVATGGGAPCWSPDGKQILVTKVKMPSRDGERFTMRLTVMDADGKNEKPLAEDGSGLGVFSPDGKHIAYVLAKDSDAQIVVADADGTNAKPVTTGKGIYTSPRWISDGQTLAYGKAEVTGKNLSVSVWVLPTPSHGEAKQVSLPKGEAGLNGEWDALPAVVLQGAGGQ